MTAEIHWPADSANWTPEQRTTWATIHDPANNQRPPDVTDAEWSTMRALGAAYTRKDQAVYDAYTLARDFLAELEADRDRALQPWRLYGLDLAIVKCCQRIAAARNDVYALAGTAARMRAWTIAELRRADRAPSQFLTDGRPRYKGEGLSEELIMTISGPELRDATPQEARAALEIARRPYVGIEALKTIPLYTYIKPDGPLTADPRLRLRWRPAVLNVGDTRCPGHGWHVVDLNELEGVTDGSPA